MQSQIAVMGLGVMGANLAMNLADHGFRVSVSEIDAGRRAAFAAGLPSRGGIRVAESLPELVGGLERPRRVLMMVPAGAAVDAAITSLSPLLENGDILIDGGNSRHQDTERRAAAMAEQGILFVGMGVSGGEEGARKGPSLMPGGAVGAWTTVAPLFSAIAARADGEPCCAWMGAGGAGHFVKAVHNGIEYGDMQLIAEAWHLLREGAGLENAEAADVFSRWNEGPLDSYLIEVTAAILRVRESDGSARVERILDAAGQKGTGRWTAIDALEHGVPLTLISEAVNARFLSAMHRERQSAARVLARHEGPPRRDSSMIDSIRDALYGAKILSYAQGFMLLANVSAARGWDIPLASVANVWRAGCIIRSRFLGDISRAYRRDPALSNLLLDDFFRDAVLRAEAGWRRAIVLGIGHGIPLPAMSAALAFLDGYRSARLPANLLQAQRDYFGAHTYQRTDDEPGQRFHTRWSGDKTEIRIDD